MGPLFSALLATALIGAGLLAVLIVLWPFIGARAAITYAVAAVVGGLLSTVVVGIALPMLVLVPTQFTSRGQVVAYLCCLGIAFAIGGAVSAWVVKRRRAQVAMSQVANS